VADTGRFVAESFRIGRNVQLSIPHSKHQIVFIRARYSWRCLAAFRRTASTSPTIRQPLVLQQQFPIPFLFASLRLRVRLCPRRFTSTITYRNVTPRCARKCGPGGPHYVQSRTTFKAALRSKPHYVQTHYVSRPHASTTTSSCDNNSPSLSSLRLCVFA
jgi:hypothetical protein